MRIRVEPNAAQATTAAADWLIERLLRPETRNVMVAGGNTPLALYAEVAARKPRLHHVNVFVLDEYLGVPEHEPRSCSNLLRRAVVEAWGIPHEQYHWISSNEHAAAASIADHERAILASGGLDLVILGLGRNGHIGFNEPGSPPNAAGRIVSLSPTSVEANRQWFGGDFAPSRGVTTGMQTILSAKTILLLAFGSHKAQAVAGTIEGPQDSACPASFLQAHSDALVLLDQEAAAGLARAFTVGQTFQVNEE
jgi:glucosamine-6-phosphate deaminase